MKYPKHVIYHIANERDTKVVKKKNGQRYSPRGTKLKKMGVLPGVSDLNIPIPNGIYAGFYLELKKEVWKKGKRVRGSYPSADQISFIKKMHSYGQAVAVVWNIDEFMKYVDDYMKCKEVRCEYLYKNNHIT